ncbi:MAG TPA: hypothetical protein VFB21_07045 [Chthonomonadaceae bacterium]|nr:hypothetical protein [Chthonomonadaceae bacterium]
MQWKNAQRFDARMHRFAAEAYARCVDWFGPPDDPQRPYQLICSRMMGLQGNHCVYNWLLHCYGLFIAHDERFEEICSSIGHEMSHRVTMCRPGLHKQPWINETLAHLVSAWFLHEQGYADYVRTLEAFYVKQPGQVDITQFKTTQKRRGILVGLRNEQYPPEFAQWTWRLAMALSILLPSQYLCRLVGAASLNAWVEALPSEYHPPVCHLLELPDAPAFPESAPLYHAYGRAMEILGKTAEARAAYEHSLLLEPDEAGKL